MSAARHFPPSYGMGRKRFLDAVKAEGAVLEALQNPTANGPRDEPLYMDVARLGPAPGEAAKLLLLTSAVHGVEGFCGSGLQTGLVREDMHTELEPDTALVLVHAVNPYGFAHVRRVNENNIDLNRNFLDHTAPHPDDSAYGTVHDLICPPDLPDAKDAWDAKIRAYIDDHGLPAFQAAVSGGQWSHADGLFHGGQAPAWSNVTLREIVQRHGAGARSIVHLDLHTGLGPYGVGELIAKPGTSGTPDKARAFFTGVTSTEDGSSVSAPLRGVVTDIWTPVEDKAEVMALTLEFGTRDLYTVLDALRLDNWLHLHGDVESERGRAIKEQIRDALFPDEDRWKDMVFTRTVEVVRGAIRALNA